MFDRNGDGLIDIQELDYTMKNFGRYFTQSELHEMMNNYEGFDTVDFPAFLAIIVKKMEYIQSEEGIIEPSKIFDIVGD
jgi:Ca2+-binding EF-hand superfamily protein